DPNASDDGGGGRGSRRGRSRCPADDARTDGNGTADSARRTLRRALGLTQEEFAARYHIPLGTLRDWEQGRTEPDQPARAYLKVIASNPEEVSRALAGGPAKGRHGAW